MLDDFDRMEAGFFMQFQLAEQPEAIELIDEARVVAYADKAAQPLKIPDRPHPDAVILLPEHLIVGGPVQEV